MVNNVVAVVEKCFNVADYQVILGGRTLNDFVAQIIRADAKNYSTPKTFAQQSDYFFTLPDCSSPREDVSNDTIIHTFKSLPQDHPWNPEALRPVVNRAVTEWCEKHNRSGKEAYQYLRGLLANGKPGPGINYIVAILGREETLRRLGADSVKEQAAEQSV